MAAKWGWGRSHAMSWGNGVIRISLKDAIAVIGALLLAYGAWRDLKDAVNTDIAANKRLEAQVSQISDQYGAIEDRVLVLETVARTTQAKVTHIAKARIFAPDVKVVKAK